MRVQPHAGTISTGGGYLYRRTAQNNVLHAGVDIGAPRGTVVVAPADGQVVAVERADRSPYKGYGPQSVLLRDDDGLFHLLAHLEPDDLADPRDPDNLTGVGAGVRVDAGDELGRVGKFNHTHWELRTKPLKGDPMNDSLVRANTVDPLAWLEGSTVVTLPPLVVSQPKPRTPASTATNGGWIWIALALLILSSD